MHLRWTLLAVSGLLSSLPWSVLASRNSSTSSALVSSQPFSVFGDRPDGCPKCPSCFNCNTASDVCLQFAECKKYNGQCACPDGFGGENCSQPLCGGLPDGDQRLPRGPDEKSCDCKDGWTGINCNVCEANQACDALMPEDDNGLRTGGVCYKHPLVVKKNYQMCDVTNKPILDQLDGQIPQATFSCDASDETCTFQFWVDEVESFYCALDTCTWDEELTSNRNTTNYRCENMKCRCVPGRMLCGENGSVDIGDFLDQRIKGPARFTSVSTEGGSSEDGSVFDEPAMNELIQSIFAQKSIFLDCHSGECLYHTELPGYQKPIPKINTPLIAGVIAGCALFVVALVLIVWYLSRRSYDKHGPIYLDDSDDERTRLLMDHKPASLQFEDVTYAINGKPILNGVSGIAQPGQITAVMGASGAGKTTFLDILARKNKRGVTAGNFYVSGERVSDDEFRNVIGFVDQDDTMLPTLTVHETILTSALLRLPRDMGNSAKEQKVFEVEKQLGIYHIRDQLIGSEEGKGRGISGGEKRRVGIACELVTSPSILFLDEPTSGLDAFNAFNVIECLVALAKTYNRTIIFTIHQPRSNIVALFDQLILLAKGHTVYSGPFGTCQAYFDSIGYSCPPGFNIADYLVDLTMHVGDLSEPEQSDAGSLVPRTTTSSVRAVKSIASRSNMSVENEPYGSPTESSSRPTGGRERRPSLKQQQDRKLFTRKPSSGGGGGGGGLDTPATDRSVDEVLDSDASQQWLRLSRAHGSSVPPQVLDDPHQLPPPASGLGTELDHLVSAFAASRVAHSVREEISTSVERAEGANGASNGANGTSSTKPSAVQGFARVGLLAQFRILSARTWKNLYRNPMLMLAHYAISILVAVLCGYLFYGLTADIKGFQNRLGLIFFLLALLGFSTLTSLVVFSSERLLFLRERSNGYYSPVVYFATKVLFDIVPLRLIPPIILAVVVYPMTGLLPEWHKFLVFVLVLVLFNLTASAICLLIGILCKEPGLANLIGSLHMLFSLLFAGFLLNHDALPPSAAWLQKLSMFHYGFEALIVNEVADIRLIDHKYGLDIEVPGGSILSSFGFNALALWDDVVGLVVMSAVVLVVAYVFLHFFLVERR